MSALPKRTEEFSYRHDDEVLDRQTYQFFADLMYQLSGVNLPHNPKNESLVKNRISKLMRKTKISSYKDLVIELKKSSQNLINEFISCLTTNKTHFFREEAHFDWFEDYLKKHFNNSNELRVWCAAASTGQEPYTISILLHEHLNESQLKRTKFLATDIDSEVLRKAANGVYKENEMEGCPSSLINKYFEVVKGKEVTYRAKDNIAQMIRFARFNLIQDSYPFKNKFDVIFCRNVLIYFDPPTVKKVVDQLAAQLSPKGVLILGHSEAGSGKHTKMRQIAQSMFQNGEDRRGNHG